MPNSRPIHPTSHLGLSQGIVVPRAQPLLRPRTMHSSRTPTNALEKIDRLLSGGGPKICISRAGGGIGDVLMTTPTVRAVKRKYQGCSLTYATDVGYLGGALSKVLEHNPYINEIADHGKVVPGDYDAYINLYCPCIPHEVPGAPPIHRIDLFAKYAGVELPTLEDKKVDYILTDQERRWAQDFLYERGATKFHYLVLVNPFASNPARQWGVDKWQKMIGYLTAYEPRVRIITVTHDSDHDKQTRWDQLHTNRMHNYDVRCIAAVMANCHLTICPDSALLHVGQALDLRLLALFGQTDYRARTCYSSRTSVICPGKDLAAFPTWYANHPAREISWRMIDPEVVAQHAIKILREEIGDPANPHQGQAVLSEAPVVASVPVQPEEEYRMPDPNALKAEFL